MKIYTKTGDNGLTSLIGGTRVEKNDIRVKAYGSIDELNANIGFLKVLIDNKSDIYTFLESIQAYLFEIGAHLASDKRKEKIGFDEKTARKNIREIEDEIDEMTKKLPSLNCFVLPGENQAAAYAHICRTVCRRVEQNMYDMNVIYEINKNALIYINRLSDYLFELSRGLLFQLKIE